MSISRPELTGQQQLAAISRSMAGLQRAHFGRESTKVNAYAIKDMIVVVARLKHLTPLEQSMVDGGEPERVVALRAEFARVMAGRYRHTVEQVTGRTVVALMSQAHVDPDILVETFFLDQPFEPKATQGLAEVLDLPEAVGPSRGQRRSRESADETSSRLRYVGHRPAHTRRASAREPLRTCASA
ncbi:MAG TPA: Na-translocating system protein MpsC family protein [Solirubrobacteraceae bacterium]